MPKCDVEQCPAPAKYEAFAAVRMSDVMPPIIVDLPFKVCQSHNNFDVAQAIAGPELWFAMKAELRELGFLREPNPQTSSVEFRRIDGENESEWAKKRLKIVSPLQ